MENLITIEGRKRRFDGNGNSHNIYERGNSIEDFCDTFGFDYMGEDDY